MTEAPISSLIPLPSTDVLRARFVGRPINELPTPSILLDKAKLQYNCEQMLQTVEQWDCMFRAHVKTLKTAESTTAQVGQSREKAIIVSTLAEAWGAVQSGLVKQGIVKDIYSDLKVLIDHPNQVKALQAALETDLGKFPPMNVFIKIDCGYVRAGLSVDSPVLPILVQTLAQSSQLCIFGVYTHAGFSYDSKNSNEANSYLSTEMQSLDRAAQLVKQVSSSIPSAKIRTPLVLSVGSTPTAHAAGTSGQSGAAVAMKSKLTGGELELHAGNYPALDLQQVATNAIPNAQIPGIERCALSVLATITASYPSRDEAMLDGGGIAFAKDLGPIPGYGHVVWPKAYIGWQLGRVAQEHGVMTLRPVLGDKVQIIPQHACMTAAAHPWYFVFDSSTSEQVPTVVDIWVPWKGW
ncbi:uncharacterized protein FA14DRAFT_124625 [Meira miltonrushii]|uniref:D-serine dehydratase-like domain-containing protein n=1 Tax=Meira miltonrushii TaxID=1280837 RepID=A0A316V9I4_9BASI|nr:uncharacterized protein FA14DRAFT_124625 [Meira miltonrushii]PWN34160.1 hypothetical protein FA14DRAFT_124625 [Meira miltonrushii]